jgi:hypothetical protein
MNNSKIFTIIFISCTDQWPLKESARRAHAVMWSIQVKERNKATLTMGESKARKIGFWEQIAWHTMLVNLSCWPFDTVTEEVEVCRAWSTVFEPRPRPRPLPRPCFFLFGFSDGSRASATSAIFAAALADPWHWQSQKDAPDTMLLKGKCKEVKNRIVLVFNSSWFLLEEHLEISKS